MKILTTILLFISFTFYIQGQVISSPCIVTDSLRNFYEDDADRITIRHIFDNDLDWKDSVEIPHFISDSILKALVAVYNAHSLPARDTVVSIFDLHTSWEEPKDEMREFFIFTKDTSLYWMKELSLGNLVTGHPIVDSMISYYDLSITHTNGITDSYLNVHLGTQRNFNLTPVVLIFDTIFGTDQVLQNIYHGDGNKDIKAVLNSDHIELTYSKKWGDCPMGCIWSRHWKFRVFQACQVEFIESYGDTLPSSLLSMERTKTIIQKSISVFPNPFNDVLQVNGSKEVLRYIIYDRFGRNIKSGNLQNEKIKDLDSLSKGIYFLSIQTMSMNTYNFSVIKN